MKSLSQQILIGLAGCVALTLVFGYSLSMAVNYGVAKFEEQAGEFLPGTASNAPTDSIPASP
jgi:hypothetical protein